MKAAPVQNGTCTFFRLLATFEDAHLVTNDGEVSAVSMKIGIIAELSLTHMSLCRSASWSGACQCGNTHTFHPIGEAKTIGPNTVCYPWSLLNSDALANHVPVIEPGDLAWRARSVLDSDSVLPRGVRQYWA